MQMNFNLKNWIYRLAIRRALKKPSPARIPLSLPRAATNDFFEVNVLAHGADTKSFYISGQERKSYVGVYFPYPYGAGPRGRFPVSKVHNYKVQIRHYLRGYEFSTSSPVIFLLQQLVRYHWLLISQDRLAQFFFNRRTLSRHDRIEILKTFVVKTTADPQYRTNAIDLVSDLHSLRTFSHPSRDSIIAYYRLILQSFREAGDLSLDNNSYQLTGQGVTTLAQYELEERRFRENLRQQKQITRLTVVIVIVGLLQAFVTYTATSPQPSSQITSSP